MPSGSAASRSGSKVTTSAPGGGEQLGVLGVAEGERRPAGDGDHRPPIRGRRRPRRPDPRRSTVDGGAVRASRRNASRSTPVARPARPSRLDRLDRLLPALGRPGPARGAGDGAVRSVAPQDAEHRHAGRRRAPRGASASCRSEPTLLRITPPIRTSGRRRRSPCTSAATDRRLRGGVDDQHDRAPAAASRRARWRRSPLGPERHRRTGPSRPRRRRGRAPARPCSEQRGDPLLADSTGRGCARAARWRARGSRGRCSRARPCAARPSVPGAPQRRHQPGRRRSSCRCPKTAPRRPAAGQASAARALTTRCPSGPSGRRPSGA